uniref:Large ribosomal subunit protein bL17m n=1 Tax=Arion vulgaris TaxID=1028688 RepID=A0A0B6YAR0_9EUPU
MLRFKHRMRPRKITVVAAGSPEERLKRLRQLVTGLIRYERVEPTYSQADEARQYAERLLYLAIKNGDSHQPTMELANFWLLEKDLVHKLFKVLVPRYKNYKTCYTDLHKLAITYPGYGSHNGLLELRGNPWPPVIAKQRDTKQLLSNVLLSAARRDYYNNKQKSQSTSSVSKNEFSSSVDPQQEDDNSAHNKQG